MHSAICPLFSMFNHDCEPSAEWPGRQGDPVSVIAKKDIKAGEEITVSYVGEIPLESDRRMRLVAQIGCVCECARCHKERRDSLKKLLEDGRAEEALQQYTETLTDDKLFQLLTGISKKDICEP